MNVQEYLFQRCRLGSDVELSRCRIAPWHKFQLLQCFPGRSGELQRQVFLGFTNDGRFLLSYSTKLKDDEGEISFNHLDDFDEIYSQDNVYRLHWWTLEYQKHKHRAQLKLEKTCILFDGEVCSALLVAVHQWPRDNSKLLVYGLQTRPEAWRNLPYHNVDSNQYRITVVSNPSAGNCPNCVYVRRKNQSTYCDDRYCFDHGWSVSFNFLVEKTFSLPNFTVNMCSIDNIIIVTNGVSVMAIEVFKYPAKRNEHLEMRAFEPETSKYSNLDLSAEADRFLSTFSAVFVRSGFEVDPKATKITTEPNPWRSGLLGRNGRLDADIVRDLSYAVRSGRDESFVTLKNNFDIWAGNPRENRTDSVEIHQATLDIEEFINCFLQTHDDLKYRDISLKDYDTVVIHICPMSLDVLIRISCLFVEASIFTGLCHFEINGLIRWNIASTAVDIVEMDKLRLIPQRDLREKWLTEDGADRRTKQQAYLEKKMRSYAAKVYDLPQIMSNLPVLCEKSMPFIYSWKNNVLLVL